MPVRIVPGSLKLGMSRGFRKMSGTTQKLLVAMFRFKKTGTLLAELGARLKMRRERRTTEVFCFFTFSRRDLSAEENRIDVVKVILKLTLSKQKVSSHLEALKVSKPGNIFHARILKKLL